MSDYKIPSIGGASEEKLLFEGNLLLFYAFDVSDDIDLAKIKELKLGSTYVSYSSPYFKNYHIPLSFDMSDLGEEEAEREDCISCKIHHFGVISFCYKIPFFESLNTLRHTMILMTKKYEAVSEEDVTAVVSTIRPAIHKESLYNLKNSYYAIQVNPAKEGIPSDSFQQEYGEKIASLLRLETEDLSAFQRDDILSSMTGYYGQDLIVIDNKSAFIYDFDYFETVEFFEMATVQKLELQCFDRLLDQTLSAFYERKAYKVPLKAYIPLVGIWDTFPIENLAQLRVEISVITERLENSIKLAGDAYYDRLYAVIVEKFSLHSWKESINRKLDIIEDLYTFHHNNYSTIREEILTIVIIILIAVEAIGTFLR